MLHEVRIFGPDGKLKKLITKQELSREHWKSFHEATNDIYIGKLAKGRVPRMVRDILDVEFPDFSDEFKRK